MVEETVSTSFVSSEPLSFVRTAVGVVVCITVLSLLVSMSTVVEEAIGIDSVWGVSVDFLSPDKVAGVSSSMVVRGELSILVGSEPKVMAVALQVVFEGF